MAYRQFIRKGLVVSALALSACTTTPKTDEYKFISQINNEVNKQPYVKDINNYGVEDYMATPEEFYKNGGDCEDYAMAKYELLKDKFPTMLLIGQDGWSGGKHVVLQVSLQDGLYILDNGKSYPVPLKWWKKDYINIRYHNPGIVRQYWGKR